MFACFDQPDLKATFTLHVTAPFDWQVVSNTGGRTDRGRRRRLRSWCTSRRPSASRPTSPRWSPGPYAQGAPTRTTASRWASTAGPRWPSTSTPTRSSAVTKQGFDFFHRVFDYPLPVRQVRPALRARVQRRGDGERRRVTFLEDYVFRSKVTDAAYERRAETILHELAHMWFGDLVTMRWWDDLWLNESFATYISTLVPGRGDPVTTAWTTFANTEKAWAYRQDQLPSTHPIAADIPDVDAVEVNFDGITYAKGASVLKQLVAYVGQDEFLAGRARLLPQARVRQHHAGRPARRAGGELRAATCPSGPSSGWRPPGQHPAAGRSS